MTGKVLFVEDNPNDLELTMHALSQGRFMNQIEIARDGAEALEYVQQRGAYAHLDGEPPPRVVLLDLKLPKLSGIEVLRELKADPRTRAIPVVMLTSSAEDADLRHCYALGVNSYIVKPVDIEQFFRAIRQLGMYWLVLNQPPQLPP